MRCHWIILLVVAALLAKVDEALKTPKRQINLPNIQVSIKTGSHDVSTQRFLRAHKLTDDNDYDTDEERGVSTSAVETLTNSLKSTVTNPQLEGWLKKGESVDDVFKLLTLDKAADDLLANPQLNSWISYMKLFNKENPTKKASLIATLTAHYGDEGLAKIVEAAKQVSSTAGIAKRVQTEQVHRWLVDGKTPDDVFAMLKLDKAGTELFTQPQVVTWAKYMDEFNKANPDKQKTLFSTVATRFDDETLAQMLIAAKKVPSTENIAIRVQSVQTKLWLSSGKTPEDVFKLLQLDKVGLTLLDSPIFSAWTKYTDDFRKINYGTELTTIETLTKFYSGDVLTEMILAAGKAPGTASISTRLQSEQLRNWYVQGFSVEEAFASLKLHTSGVTLFENPLFNVWTKYTVYLGNVDPSYKVDLLTTLTNMYGEGNVLKILRAGNTTPSTKKMATELSDEQVKRWLVADKKPMDIYSILRVERVGSDDPNWLLYIKYLKAYAMY